MFCQLTKSGKVDVRGRSFESRVDKAYIFMYAKMCIL